MRMPSDADYMIVCSVDGVMRVVGKRAMLEAERQMVETVMYRAWDLGPRSVQGEVIPPEKPALSPTDKVAMRGKAKASGFTGDTCDTCGGFNMKRVGTCLTCSDCGSTTGCG